jgi:hypothetical protein
VSLSAFFLRLEIPVEWIPTECFGELFSLLSSVPSAFAEGLVDEGLQQVALLIDGEPLNVQLQFFDKASLHMNHSNSSKGSSISV